MKMATIILLLMLSGCGLNVEAKGKEDDITRWADVYCDYETNVEYLVNRSGDFAIARQNLNGTLKECGK